MEQEAYEYFDRYRSFLREAIKERNIADTDFEKRRAKEKVYLIFSLLLRRIGNYRVYFLDEYEKLYNECVLASPDVKQIAHTYHFKIQ